MNGITWIHVAGGMMALVSGAVAVAMQKGGRMHVSAGTWFCISMFVLGVTASILAPFKSPPDSPIGGINGWMPSPASLVGPDSVSESRVIANWIDPISGAQRAKPARRWAIG